MARNYMPDYPNQMIEISKEYAKAMEAAYIEAKEAAARKARRKRTKAARKRNRQK